MNRTVRSPRRPSPRAGFTLVELLVVVAIIATLLGILLPVLKGARAGARSLEDKSQLRQIQQAMLAFASGNDGIMPTPGLINRQPDPVLGNTAGRGAEDYSKNTSAALYSALIAGEYFLPDLLVSPVETNGTRIAPYTEYDYGQIDPAADVYWDGDVPTGDPAVDTGFRADIAAGPSHTSYYHLALCGRRKGSLWRNTASDKIAHLSNRAPYRGDGETSGSDDYTRSYTLLLHGNERSWSGHVAFADGHVELLSTFLPVGITYVPEGGDVAKDNIFAPEFSDPTPGAAGDLFLCMTQSAAENEVVDYQEALRD